MRRGSSNEGDRRPLPKSPSVSTTRVGTNMGDIPPPSPTRTSSASSASSKLSLKRLTKKSTNDLNGLEPTMSAASSQYGPTSPTFSIPYESITTKSKPPLPVNYLPANSDKRAMDFAPTTLISGPIPALPQRMHHNQPRFQQQSRPDPRHDSHISRHSDDGVSAADGYHQSTPYVTRLGGPIDSEASLNAHHNSVKSVRSQASGSTNTYSNESHRKSKSIENTNTNTTISTVSSRHSSYSAEDDSQSIASHSTTTSLSTINAMMQGNEFNLERPKDDALIEAMFQELMVSEYVYAY